MKYDNFFVILVEPQGPINIGSVCRTMMNFGFCQLRLVNPIKNYKSLAAKKMALRAFDILKNALIFDDLRSALFDIQLSFGTTRRFGKYRKNFFTPSNCAKKITNNLNQNKCAIVLGPEDKGLKTKDLDLCQHFTTIDTHKLFPSMNLSHALTILLYEISNCLENITSTPLNKILADTKEKEQMLAHMQQTLLNIDFLDSQNPDHILRTFRRIFGTAGLTSRDVRIIRGMMSRIDWTEEQRQKLSKGKKNNLKY